MVGDNDFTIEIRVFCDLVVGGTTVDKTEAMLGQDLNVAERQSLAMTGGGTLDAAGTAVLECDSDQVADFLNASLTAIRVATLDTQP